MKRPAILCIILLISLSVFSQGNKPVGAEEKSKGKSGKVKEKKEKEDEKDKSGEKDDAGSAAQKKSHEDVIWEGTSDKGGKGPKLSKNIPNKVSRSFQRDFPNASSVTWYKYRGDWTPTFQNGLFRSTAVYHANGERRDTRTPIPRSALPPKIDDIFKKRPSIRLGDIIRIETPAASEIFRLKTWSDGVLKFMHYDQDGNEVTYDY